MLTLVLTGESWRRIMNESSTPGQTLGPQVATIILKENVVRGAAGCQVCSKPLVEEHGGETNLRYGLCLEHLTVALGDGTRQEAMAMLLARGVIMVCYYTQNRAFKVRVEVRSSRRSELTMLERQFEVGRIFRHTAGGVLRWSCASLSDLHVMGSILMPVIPEFGIFLQSYVIQPDPVTRSAYAEAFMKKMGRRTTHLLSFV